MSSTFPINPTNPVIIAINNLPTIERNIIVYTLKGMSVPEIGNKINRPFPDIKIQISSILSKLKWAQLQGGGKSSPEEPQINYNGYGHGEGDNSWLLGLPVSTQLLLNFDTVVGLLETVIREPQINHTGVGMGAGSGGGGGFDPGDSLDPVPNPPGNSNPNPFDPFDPFDPSNPELPPGTIPPIIKIPPVIHPIPDFFLPGFEFFVYYKPSLFVTEIEYSEELRTVILNYPPTAPIPYFYPILNSSQKFMISLEPSVGKIEEKPVYIYDTDVQYFDKIMVQQRNEGFKVVFKYQGDVKNYEIFRIEEEPTSYLDFASSETKRITTTSNGENVLFEEYVVPNKKYYYTFRTRDKHDGFSNPSPIFVVKLYSNDGIENLDVNTFEIVTPQPKQSAMFKKFIEISPNLLQKTYSELKEKLGLVDESVYNENFLLRITSKHSGKTVDLVLRFNKTNEI